jgi:hypothetical protein
MPRPLLPRASRALVPLGVFAATFLFRLASVGFANDHFDRISKGRQILAFGDIPFRDFFDPGFFMTLYSSAAVQGMFGDTLLGEALLTITFISLGFALAFVLARKVSGSVWMALAVTAAGVLTFPRLYNYDKVLFLPLGLFVAWRYVARPAVSWLLALGVVTAVAAMYRYDSSIYIAAGAVAAVLAVHWSEPMRAFSRLAAYGASVLAALAPAAVYIHVTAGLPDALRQIAEYGRREGLRTEIFQPPRFQIDRFGAVVVTGRPVKIRWPAGLPDEERASAEAAYTLQNGKPEDGRTWAYVLVDVSPANVRALLLDPRVEDTHGIDRSEEGSRRVSRSFTLMAIVLTRNNAAAWLAWLLLLVPLLTVAALASRSTTDAGVDRSRTPALLAAAAVCLSAGLVLLRDPLEARIGDVAAPAVPLIAWLIAWVYRPRVALGWRALKYVAAAALLVSAVAIGHLVSPVLAASGSLSLDQLTASPPSSALLSSSRTVGVAEYLRRCTGPDDRVTLAWFAPEVFFLSGRGFAGGTSVYFGGHWSSPQHQRTMIRRLHRDQSPVAVISVNEYPEFARVYPVLDSYLTSAYDVGGESSLGDPEGQYRILIRKGTNVVGAFSGLPCLR